MVSVPLFNVIVEVTDKASCKDQAPPIPENCTFTGNVRLLDRNVFVPDVAAKLGELVPVNAVAVPTSKFPKTAILLAKFKFPVKPTALIFLYAPLVVDRLI